MKTCIVLTFFISVGSESRDRLVGRSSVTIPIRALVFHRATTVWSFWSLLLYSRSVSTPLHHALRRRRLFFYCIWRQKKTTDTTTHHMHAAFPLVCFSSRNDRQRHKAVVYYLKKANKTINDQHLPGANWAYNQTQICQSVNEFGAHVRSYIKFLPPLQAAWRLLLQSFVTIHDKNVDPKFRYVIQLLRGVVQTLTSLKDEFIFIFIRLFRVCHSS